MESVDASKSLLDFKILKQAGLRFVKGDLATLQSEGSRWSGEIVSVKEDEDNRGRPSFYTVLSIGEATCWFLSRMKGLETKLSLPPHALDCSCGCRAEDEHRPRPGIAGAGRVVFVDELKGLLHFNFKLPKPLHPHFLNGELATLQRTHGRRWTGELILTDGCEDKEGQSSLDTTLRIRVPPAGGTVFCS